MRYPVDAERVRKLMAALGAEARHEGRIYLVGGATAVLIGWRSSTIDVDLKLVPEDDDVLRAIPRLKDELEINVELASPDAFIPEVGDGRRGAPSWPKLYRFPAIDAPSFRRAVEGFVAGEG